MNDQTTLFDESPMRGSDMGIETKIEWCDHSASPWHGCSEVHTGCDNCYARTMAKRNPGTLGVWGKDGTRVMSASFAKNCRRWNAGAKKRGVIESVFPSICDPFEDWQGPILNSHGTRQAKDRIWVTMDDLRRDLFELIDECHNLRFLLLTKRPENVRRMWPSADVFDSESEHKAYWPNVAILTSVSDQATADAMIPPLLACRDLVPVLGVSLEPMLGPVDLRRITLRRDGTLPNDLSNKLGDYVLPLTGSFTDSPRLDWVIVGGESGHGARPMHPQWVRSIRDQCVEAGTPFFFKQWGEFCEREQAARLINYPNGKLPASVYPWPSVQMFRVGKKAAGRLLDGRTWDEFPQTKGVVG